MNEQDLFRLKKKVEDAKNQTSELVGQQKVLLQQLKENFNCTTLDEIYKKGKQLDIEIEKLSEQIESMTDELESKLDEQ
jgi:flagellar capping protein FliD